MVKVTDSHGERVYDDVIQMHKGEDSLGYSHSMTYEEAFRIISNKITDRDAKTLIALQMLKEAVEKATQYDLEVQNCFRD